MVGPWCKKERINISGSTQLWGRGEENCHFKEFITRNKNQSREEEGAQVFFSKREINL